MRKHALLQVTLNESNPESDKYTTPNPSCTLNQKQVSYLTPNYITDGHENDKSQNEEHTLKIKMKKKMRRSNNF